jgi:hypothetical protein
MVQTKEFVQIRGLNSWFLIRVNSWFLIRVNSWFLIRGS